VDFEREDMNEESAITLVDVLLTVLTVFANGQEGVEFFRWVRRVVKENRQSYVLEFSKNIV